MMDFAITNGHSYKDSSTLPCSLTKFNSALTAGLLNPPMSPPPLPTDKARSSPTLFEMMASEPDAHPTTTPPPPQILVPDRQTLTMERISYMLGRGSPGNQFNDLASTDINLTLTSKDGVTVSVNVHRQILVAHSRFFAVKLSDRWAKQQRSPLPYIVEIADCDDVVIYMETLRLMYCNDIRKKLMRDDVSRVLGILKVT